MDCIHCGNCTRHCAFLANYKLDLAGFAQHPELAYHCFLCGECTACCPKDIDGREIALNLRRERIAQAGSFSALPEAKARRMLVLEKKNYLFNSYRRAKPGPVLFPGCNFPSFYPKTTRKLIKLLEERAGIGTVMDCCGKPIAELGMMEESRMICDRLCRRLHRIGATELVVLCPNCCAFLKGRLDLPVVRIYQKLQELELVQPLRAERFALYLPCPDRRSREMMESFLPLLQGQIEQLGGVQCCGLGGSAAASEPQIAAGFAQKMQSKGLSEMYTYCASCAGQFARSGCEGVHHLLVELLRTGETPVKGMSTLLNRAKYKLIL